MCISALCVSANGEYIFSLTAGWTWGHCSRLVSLRLPYPAQYIFLQHLRQWFLEWADLLFQWVDVFHILSGVIPFQVIQNTLNYSQQFKKIISVFIFTFLVLHGFDTCALAVMVLLIRAEPRSYSCASHSTKLKTAEHLSCELYIQILSTTIFAVYFFRFYSMLF